MIKDFEISVLIQGPILGKDTFNTGQEITRRSIELIRKLLPKAELIISTWENSPIKGLDHDKLVISKDPMAFKFSDGEKLNNLNRVIVSTQAGLAAITRKYCLKLRSDIAIETLDFLQYFNQFPRRTDQYILFKRKVLVSSFFTYKFLGYYNKKMPTPFHVSDWVYFGLTEDLITLYKVPLVKEPKFSEYFKNIKNTKQGLKFDLFSFKVHWRFPPEQYIFFAALKKRYRNLKFTHKLDYNAMNIKQSEHALINNFITIEPKKWRFISLKEEYYYKCKSIIFLPFICWKGMYTLHSYKKSYNKLFREKSFILPDLVEVVYFLLKYFRTPSPITSLLSTTRAVLKQNYNKLQK